MKIAYRRTLIRHEGGTKDGAIVDPSKITLAFVIGGTPGRHTCRATCDCCFLPFSLGDSAQPYTRATVEAHMDMEASQISDLRAQGFKVTPMIPDTFSWDGKYLERELLHHNTLYDQDEITDAAIAWTSGVPLLSPNAPHQLAFLRAGPMETAPRWWHRRCTP